MKKALALAVTLALLISTAYALPVDFYATEAFTVFPLVGWEKTEVDGEIAFALYRGKEPVGIEVLHEQVFDEEVVGEYLPFNIVNETMVPEAFKMLVMETLPNELGYKVLKTGEMDFWYYKVPYVIAKDAETGNQIAMAIVPGENATMSVSVEWPEIPDIETKIDLFLANIVPNEE